MINRNFKICSIVVFLCSFSTPAMAYLDPGSGSIILYFLAGVFATFIYAIKSLFFDLSIIFYSFFTKDKINLNVKKNIVFYSEGGQYWNLFKPIIEELNNLNIECSYFTSDKFDDGLKFRSTKFDSFFIGDRRFSLISLNYLQAQILVMTTPQLEIMELKRSKKVNYFVHLIHSPIDALFYNKFAFDYFDCVMCSGKHQIESIRALEDKRGTSKKKLLETGLTYYDVMENNKKIEKQQLITVLIAPSWSNKSVLTNNFKKLSEIIEVLLKNHHAVIFRPHPHMLQAKKQEMDDLEQVLSVYKSLIIDKSPSGVGSMNKADVIISDLSGVIFDFFFVYKKPIIVVNSEVNIAGFEAEDVDKTPWEIEIINQIASKINLDDIDEIPSIVATVIQNNNIQKSDQIRLDSVFNYGKAGKVAANQLIDILKDVQC
ncbi:CDP-glycerol glycerophosphotransferase family protein [Alphaproteobacteria bacterium]|nr:CDP-glycerol glycerophosphotransferase family protein [Alphaproteobacteria bacterium]